MLIAKIDGANITVADYRSLFPNTSFPPNGPSAEFLASESCMPVTVWKAHSTTQKLVPADPYIEDNQVFTVQVVDKTAEDIEAEKRSKAAQIRAERDKRLADTDWIVVKSMETEVPGIEAWKVYRQALRGLPQQASFPDNVVWPEKPIPSINPESTEI